MGDTYLVESSNNKFILRVYRSTHRSLPQIEEEVKLLFYLKDNGVSASFPCLDSSGSAIQKIDAIEGERHAVLFTYAPGNTVKTLNKNQLRSFGAEMAKFHNVSASMQPDQSRWNFDLQTTMFQPLDKIAPGFKEDQETYLWLQQTATEIQLRLSEIDTSNFSKGYCHFDFLPKNMHFDGDKVTFFDFDFMGYGWLVYDISSFCQHLMLDVYTGRMTQEESNIAFDVLLTGYREHRIITEQELATIPYLSIGFWLFYMGFHTTHDQFYTFTQPPHLKFYTGFMKHLVQTYFPK